MREARWDDAARFVDLGVVSTTRDRFVRKARGQKPPPKLTAEYFLQTDSTMPRAVAEYSARRFNERVPAVNLIAHEYARVFSLDTLAQLPLAEVAARWLEAKDERWMIRLTLLGNRSYPSSSRQRMVHRSRV